jgi:hypothetical protein
LPPPLWVCPCLIGLLYNVRTLYFPRLFDSGTLGYPGVITMTFDVFCRDANTRVRVHPTWLPKLSCHKTLSIWTPGLTTRVEILDTVIGGVH